MPKDDVAATCSSARHFLSPLSTSKRALWPVIEASVATLPARQIERINGALAGGRDRLARLDGIRGCAQWVRDTGEVDVERREHGGSHIVLTKRRVESIRLPREDSNINIDCLVRLRHEAEELHRAGEDATKVDEHSALEYAR